MTSRRLMTLASYATVVAATLTVAFAQAPAPAANTPRVRSRAAIDAKLARKKAPVAQRAEDVRLWQDRQKKGVGDPFDQPQQALTFFLAQRLPSGQATLSPQEYAEALEHAAQMPIYSTDLQQFLPSRISSAPVADGLASPASPAGSTPGTWQALGPGNIGGRTRALLIHPTTTTTMWAAGVAGGIWKTTNGGNTWVPKADLLVNIAVNSMILDPRNPDVLYAGTGEGFFNADAVRGAGIMKSTDGGETWAQLPSTATPDFFYVQKIVMSRGSSQRLYAATRTGIFRSVDAGATWTKVYDGTGVNGCMDLAIQTDRSVAMVVASCGTFVQASVIRAIDTAKTMSFKTVLSVPNQGRTSLAIAPSNQNIMYAMAASNAAGNFLDGLLGVWKSTNSGKTWTQTVSNTSPTTLNRLLLSNPVIATLTQCGFGTSSFLNQGWYDNVIAVDPVNPNVVWAGGIDLFRSDDGGANWGQASHWWFTPGADPEYNHADHHLVVFHPNYDGVTNKVMYSANDGGVYRTDDALAPVSYSPDPINGASPICGSQSVAGHLSWTSLNNGYETTQFYHGVPYPDASTFFGGTQDNGTIRGTLAGGINAWSSIRGGDGGYVAVNPNNTNMLWAENTGRSMQRSTDGGVSYQPFQSGITEGAGNFLFITPFAQDPSNANNMWTAGAVPWRATQSTAVPLPATIWAQAGAFLGQRIGAIAVAPSDSTRVYMGGGTGGGINNGRVFTTANALTSTGATVWTFSRPRPDPTFVSWLAVHPTNPSIVYATISTFNSATGSGHVFRSTDFGATWTNIDGSGATGIPDVPVHSILIDPDNTSNLWVGTDIGVFSSTDGGANWARENTGFANVITESLSIGTEGGVKYIYAFTHGRSVFRVQKPMPPVIVCGANARC